MLNKLVFWQISMGSMEEYVPAEGGPITNAHIKIAL